MTLAIRGIGLGYPISGLMGWRRHGFAFLAGAVGALAMAPTNLFLAMLVPMGASVLLLDSAHTAKGAALSGWWLGFGYCVAGLWWLGAAFFVEPDFIWAAPFGILGLPALLALFFAAGFWAAFHLWRPGPWRIFVLAAALGGSEWLRGTVLTGFPWNSLGMALGDQLELAQLASLIGMNGLTFITVVLFAAPVLAFEGRGRFSWLAAPALCFGCVATLYAFGAWRLAGPETPAVPGVTLRLMQPDMPLDDRFSRSHAADIMHHYFDLSTKGSYPSATGMAGITHLVWPETSFPFLLDAEPAARAEISHILPADTMLIAGAVRAEDGSDGEARAYFNAIQTINAQGMIVETADKAHLVPFGEYLPFSDLLTRLGLRQFVHAPGGFTPAHHRKVMNIQGLPPAVPLICYEAIFPSEVIPEGAARPGLLLNVTNDAWFGRTPGPYQHFSQARLRAIEQGLPLVRSANNGISAIIDGYGRTIATLPLGDSGVIDGLLPQALLPTFYSTLPHLPLAGLFYGLLTIGLLMTKRQLTLTSESRNYTTGDL